jgi:predicted amidohydrolase
MKVKVAAVQPRSFWGEEEYKNAERCLDYLEEAVDQGAQLVCFPEGYPGPCHGPMDSAGKLGSTPIEMVQEKARELKVYVSASDLEPNPEIQDTYFLTHKLISPSGEILANYKRVQPDNPTFNGYLMNGRVHVLPGDEIMVVPTPIGDIGLQICSEVLVPEISRIHMLLGADITIVPVNGPHSNHLFRGRETWLAIARARAAENLMFVIMTQNIFMEGAAGRAVITGPEETLASSTDAGVLYAELDYDRLNYMRSRYHNEEFLKEPEPGDTFARCRPAQQLQRRPEMYGMLSEPHPQALNYFYYKDGLDTYLAEEDRAKNLRTKEYAVGPVRKVVAPSRVPNV